MGQLAFRARHLYGLYALGCTIRVEVVIDVLRAKYLLKFVVYGGVDHLLIHLTLLEPMLQLKLHTVAHHAVLVVELLALLSVVVRSLRNEEGIGVPG